MKSKDPSPADLERPGEAGIGTRVCREHHRRVAGPGPGAVAPRRADDPRRAHRLGALAQPVPMRAGGRPAGIPCPSGPGSPTKIDRKSEPRRPLIVTDPFVSIIGCIPPAKLAALDDGNDGEDGFIHRILFAYPRPVRGRTLELGGDRARGPAAVARPGRAPLRPGDGTGRARQADAADPRAVGRGPPYLGGTGTTTTRPSSSRRTSRTGWSARGPSWWPTRCGWP